LQKIAVSEKVAIIVPIGKDLFVVGYYQVQLVVIEFSYNQVFLNSKATVPFLLDYEKKTQTALAGQVYGDLRRINQSTEWRIIKTR